MAKTADQLVAEVIAREGGYVNHPADRGGPTNWGITEQVARAYGYRGDMRSLPRATAAEIYRQRYWTAPGFDKVATRDEDLAAELFDAGVNMGPAQAGKFLQRALNLLNSEARTYPDVAVDGGIGPLTLAALDAYLRQRSNAEGRAVLLWLVRSFRTGRYAEIAEANKSQEAFLYGWIARQVREA
ncbi:glycoside hydrolase family 108 protein [Sphingomonas sp. 3-13AW]|uniref:glycoside hydrolase family 108 protein n=1 Tax=Sphingomonas sp. 3-13AW TaxID=3050450 RepID=UPI003BB6C423